MKRRFCMGLVCLCMCLLVACTSNGSAESEKAVTETGEKQSKVALRVVTTFAGNDGNAQTYREAIADWEEASGNDVVDMSSNSDETFKTRVINDFLTGSEPDVLFFFCGADANSFIEAGRVVSLDEIKEEFPDYIENLDESRIPASLVDGKIYAIPVSGYWEAMFVNKEVLEKAGVSLPGADYTWEQFTEDCRKIKLAGYTPIAAALGNIPHYWWEYAIFNHTSPEGHGQIPESTTEELGQAWVAGMEDIKSLYQSGFFPKYTNSVTDESTFTQFLEGKAAFLIDGSWKVGSIEQYCKEHEMDLENFAVTFVPGTEKRKATDLIGGMSMGYYITRKAWADEEKREAAVSFISYMTSDEVVPRFAKHAANILRNPPDTDSTEYNSLQRQAVDMLAASTSLTPAVQDVFQGECRETTFDEMPDIVTGRVSAESAVEMGLEIYREQGENNVQSSDY